MKNSGARSLNFCPSSKYLQLVPNQRDSDQRTAFPVEAVFVEINFALTVAWWHVHVSDLLSFRAVLLSMQCSLYLLLVQPNGSVHFIPKNMYSCDAVIVSLSCITEYTSSCPYETEILFQYALHLSTRHILPGVAFIQVPTFYLSSHVSVTKLRASLTYSLLEMCRASGLPARVLCDEIPS